MNQIMASLSVQFALYGAAWIMLGAGFRLKRSAALCWGAAWFSGALCAATFYAESLGLLAPSWLTRNLLAVGAIALVQKGVDLYAGRRIVWWDALLLLGAVLALEWLRRQGPATLLLRAGLLTLTVTWPLSLTAYRMAQWLRTNTRTRPVLIGVSIAPIVFTIFIFLARVVLVFGGQGERDVDFGADNSFALGSAMAFLVVLGAFNFSLATLVLGTLIERLRQFSSTDQLTRLANRHVMLRQLAQEYERYRRSGHGYALVMLDLDFFKRVNDAHGHHVGDQLLRGAAAAMQACIRNTDTLARMGGEEFMLLMPLTDSDGALSQAQRLCEKIRTTALATDAGPLQITVSLGVAEVLTSDKEANAAVIRADEALYRAKAAGRNRVEMAARTALPHTG